MKEGSAAQDLIQKLVFLGRNEQDYEIEGIKFSIASLSETESKEMVGYLFGLPESERISMTKSAAVAASLIKVNDIPIETIVSNFSDAGEGTMFRKKLNLVSKLQTAVVTTLFAKFDEVNKRLSEDGTDEVKN